MFQRIRAALTALLHLFVDHPLTRAQDALTDAIKAHARQRAEVLYQQDLVSYFDTRASRIDPYTRWREFANVKDKWLEHRNDLEVEQRRADFAEAKVKAARLRLASLEAP